MTVVFTSVILSFTATAPDKETAMAMAFTVVILAGLFQILFGVFRLGRYVTQMPYTVISGFMSGIGAILGDSPAAGLPRSDRIGRGDGNPVQFARA